MDISEVHLKKVSDSITLAGQQIWSKEKNGQEEIPAYLTAYFSGDGEDVTWFFDREGIGMCTENGKKKLWD